MDSKPRILLLSPLKKACGNHSTIHRIRTYLDAGYTCDVKDPDEFSSISSLQQYYRDNNIQLVVALHAFRSGRITGDDIRCILIFGGTDLNELDKDEEKMEIMTAAVNSARYLVAFSDVMKGKALHLWPYLEKQKLQVIKQGILAKPSEFSLRDRLYDTGKITKEQFFHAKIFLFVGGIRQVKDPMFLLDVFKEWHQENKDILFVIIGPKMDNDYHENFLHKVNRIQGIIYMNELSLEDTHAAIKQSFSLVNSSVSEGMAAVVLEAMCLGTPVLARDNPGNSSLITDGNTGFLFSDQMEFKEKVTVLLNDSVLYKTIAKEAMSYVTKNHNIEVERELYCQLADRSLCQ